MSNVIKAGSSDHPFTMFLWKRIEYKMNEIRECSNHEEIEKTLEDLETYLEELKGMTA